MQFGQDPLIRNQAVAVSKCAEIRISDALWSFAGYPVGTRPVSKAVESIKV